ncbi:sigma-70 family RNA polymerase sigma factor, partial [Aquipuribacter hungaricus]|uniref:sigma-70 family RNA polymerase sigma factor n=1 Tax=Aquipuribacter hungaricus TaxID=545624 RepID=UPI0030EE26C7
LLMEEVVALYLPSARRMARRFRGRGVADEDLLQVASLGLLKAVHGYEPGPGRVFLAYATPTIRGELKRHFRDYGWAVRPPRRLQELSAELSGVVQRLTHELGRSPTYREIAVAAGAGEEEVIEAVTAGQGYSTTSLDAPRGEDGSTWADWLPDGTGEVDLVPDRVALRELLLRLPDRERRILALRFFAGMTQSEIGAEVGVTQM